MAGATQRRRRKSKITLPGGGVWLVRALGAYVLLQFGWWAYLLAISGTEREQWMVLGEEVYSRPYSFWDLFGLSGTFAASDVDFPASGTCSWA